MSFLDDVHKHVTDAGKTDEEKKSFFEKLYRTIKHLYKALKIEDKAVSSV